jgi:hypothetical protein
MASLAIQTLSPMNASTPVERIDALLCPTTSPLIDLHRVDELGRLAKSLGEHPGVIGETLQEFRRALGLLNMGHASGDADSIELGSAVVREIWETLVPALRKLGAAALP